jgi:hypothetical protein
MPAATWLDAIEAPRVVLARLTAAGLLDKVGRGLYRLPSHPGSEHESLATIATKVPQAVFCLLTALQFHELTTQLPRQVWIAMPRGSHVPRIDYGGDSGEGFRAPAYAHDRKFREADWHSQPSPMPGTSGPATWLSSRSPP